MTPTSCATRSLCEWLKLTLVTLLTLALLILTLLTLALLIKWTKNVAVKIIKATVNTKITKLVNNTASIGSFSPLVFIHALVFIYFINMSFCTGKTPTIFTHIKKTT